MSNWAARLSLKSLKLIFFLLTKIWRNVSTELNYSILIYLGGLQQAKYLLAFWSHEVLIYVIPQWIQLQFTGGSVHSENLMLGVLDICHQQDLYHQELERWQLQVLYIPRSVPSFVPLSGKLCVKSHHVVLSTKILYCKYIVQSA